MVVMQVVPVSISDVAPFFPAKTWPRQLGERSVCARDDRPRELQRYR